MLAIRASYYCTLGVTSGQDVFRRDVLFNLKSIVDWPVVTSKNQQQVKIDNVFENDRQVSYYYTIVNLIYVENIGIY